MPILVHDFQATAVAVLGWVSGWHLEDVVGKMVGLETPNETPKI